MPDDTQTDPVADMLGEGSGGGPLGAISRFGRRYIALKNGSAMDVARMRMQEHLHQQDQMMQLLTHATEQGMDIGSPGFAPLLKNLPKDVAAFLPEYAHQQKQHIEGQLSNLRQGLGLTAEDLGEGSASAGAAPGTAPDVNGTGGSAPPPMAAGASPAPSGADSTAQMLSPGVAPSAPGAGPPSNPNAGLTDWRHPDFNHIAHMAAASPELKAKNRELAIATYRYVEAELRHSAQAPALKSVVDRLSKEHDELYSSGLKLGTNISEKEVADKLQAAREKTIQDRIDARQKAGFTHADAHPKAPADAAFTLNNAYEKFGPEIDRINKITDPDERMQAAEALNTQIDSVDAQAEKLGLPKQGNHYRQKLDVVTHSGLGALIHGKKTVTLSPAKAETSASPKGRAVKDKSGRVIGYTTDGKTMTPVSNGPAS